MNELDQETAVRPSSPNRMRRRNVLIAISLAVLAAAAFYEGGRSRAASAAPESALPLQATPQATQESQRWHTANADTDVGPGHAEPILVGSP